MIYRYPLFRGISIKWVPIALLGLLMGAHFQLIAKPKTPPERNKKFAATFTVTNTSDAGPGSLRQAIIDANTNIGADLIEFSVFGTINLLSELPALDDTSTVIDAIPGDIIIDGSGLSDASGLILEGDYCEIYGLEISGFSGSGVNGYGIIIDADECVVGALNKGNTFIENENAGIGLYETNNSTIQSNHIGVRPNELLSNRGNGMGINWVDDGGSSPFFSDDNVIGGVDKGNIVYFNSGAGIAIYGNRNTLQGNFFRNNGGVGILIGDGSNSSDENLIGGIDAGTENTLSKNIGGGIVILGSNNQVLGNEVGLGPFGVGSHGNIGNGVIIGDPDLDYAADGNIIGNSAAGNTFLENTGFGVAVYYPSEGNNIRYNSMLCNDLGGIFLESGSGQDANAAIQPPTFIDTTINLVSLEGLNPGDTLDIYTFQSFSGCTVCQGRSHVIEGVADGSGEWEFDPSSLGLSTGQLITATVTDTDGNTSQFTTCVELVDPCLAESSEIDISTSLAYDSVDDLYYLCWGVSSDEFVTFSNNSSGVLGDDYQYVVVTDDPNPIIKGVFGSSYAFNFADLDPGIYKVMGISYTGDLSSNFDVDTPLADIDADICLEFSDNSIIIDLIDFSGSLVRLANEDETICKDGSPQEIFFNVISSSVRISQTLVVYDESDEIVAITTNNPIDFNDFDEGDYFVEVVSYSGNLNAAIGDDINGISSDTGCLGFSGKSLNGDPVQIAVRNLHEVSIDPPIDFTCNTLSVPLMGNLTNTSSFPTNFQAEWRKIPNSGPGDFTAGSDLEELDVEVDGPGQFELIVTNALTGCVAQYAETVSSNLVPPTVNAGADVPFTCNDSQLTLSGSSTFPSGLPLDYSWTKISGPGNFVGNTDTETVEVDGPGEFELTIERSDISSCSNTDLVVVTDEQIDPLITDLTATTITCADPQSTLAVTTNVSNPAYTWIDPNGATSSAPSLMSPLAGVYKIEVLNQDNGCTVEDSIEVITENELPEINNLTATLITCSNTLSTISFDTDISNAAYLWIDPDGDSFSTSGPSYETSLVGEYSIQVTNLDNGCFATNNIEVGEDKAAPEINNLTATTITCANPQSTLSVETNASNAEFLWTDPNGATSTASSFMSPTVGVYSDKGDEPGQWL